MNAGKDTARSVVAAATGITVAIVANVMTKTRCSMFVGIRRMCRRDNPLWIGDALRGSVVMADAVVARCGCQRLPILQGHGR